VLRRAATVTILAAGLLGGLAAVAHAETIRSFDVAVEVGADGSLLVVETIDYDFEGDERHGILRDIPTRFRYDDTYDRVMPVEVGSVTAVGAPDDVEVSQEPGGITRIRIGDPDRTVHGRATYTITYRVEGAMNGFPDHDELYWNATGDDWDAWIEEATVSVQVPGTIDRVGCFQGWPGSVEPCGTARSEGGRATFAAGRTLASGEGLTFVIAVPKGVVAEPVPILEERWSAATAFGVTPASLGAAGAVFAAFGLLIGTRMWRTGRDRRFTGSPVDQVMGGSEGDEAVPPGDADTEAPVEFAPPDGIRPGQVGTLIDERANVLDVTASIVDLAVRGHLHIEEIEDTGWFSKADWKLTRLPGAVDDLLAYERALLEALFQAGDEVFVSELRNTFAERLGKVQRELVQDALRRKWFRGDPERAVARWIGVGILLLLAGAGLTFVLARWTTLGIAGIAVIVCGLITLVAARWMPSRTARGTAMVRRVRGFRRVIATAETHMSRWAEQEQVFTRFLPFAIVFGLTDRWAGAFASLADEPDTSSWYTGRHPFTGIALAHSLDSFAVTTGGTLASTPAGSGSSGFGGGGFSGGGGGGGGGGSW
jgi:uncharacterized protein (TIGR04222 family)